MNTAETLYRAWVAADDAWSRELTAAFGSSAGDVRYSGRGRGLPGSALRTTHDAFVAAGDAYRAARDA